MADSDMLDSYDFSKSIKNPYTPNLKKPITIRIENETIKYFKGLSEETGIPYQTLINLFLAQCAHEHRRPSIEWK
jgi:predicted DNA binding CopG/RHH family protein